MSVKQEFAVRRRGRTLLGWTFIGFGAICLFVGAFSGSNAVTLTVSGLFFLVCGAVLWLGARNVSHIEVTDTGIFYRPVGEMIAFADIERMRVPSWAHRHDNPRNTLASIQMHMRRRGFRFVPGVIVQFGTIANVSVDGASDTELLAALRRYIAE